MNPSAVADGAARLLQRERRAEPFGSRLPARLAEISDDVGASLLDQAAVAIAAVDVDAGGAALYAHLRRRAFGTLPPWELLSLDSRRWWLSRAALARGERPPLPAIAALSPRAAAPLAAARLF